MTNKIILKLENICDTRLEDIFENGQCFRWKALENNGKRNVSYIGIYNERIYVIKETENTCLKEGKEDKSINLDVCIYLKENEKISEGNERKIYHII